jgi:hypothetical protein
MSRSAEKPFDAL